MVIPKIDEKLFEQMRDNYMSNAEREFFEQMEHKERNSFTNDGELVLDEHDNPEGFFICRWYNYEFEIGYWYEGMYEETGKRYHRGDYLVNLHDALYTNLKECEMSDRDITLLDWLREHDYAHIRYDHYLGED